MAGDRRCEALIVQSQTTAERLKQSFGPKVIVHTIPPGIDLEDWPQQSKINNHDNLRLLYLGTATAIRGFDLALEAMARLSDMSVNLRVLARGADTFDLAKMQAKISQLGVDEKVSLAGGWINRSQLIEEIHSADAVLQPFVLVPSELPVTAMEVIACGTPVIGSKIDGLPSTIGSAGIVIRQGNVEELTDAIVRLVQKAHVRTIWRDGCLQQRSAMLNWDQVTAQWEDVLHGKG
jgi:glycosyltransferase involved in cell wall biosynthesis